MVRIKKVRGFFLDVLLNYIFFILKRKTTEHCSQSPESVSYWKVKLVVFKLECFS